MRLNNLWLNGNFLKLWISETVSLFGSQISVLAIPLLAVQVLKATPVQMGVLTALGLAPILVFGLLAGAWIDRLRRHPILLWTNIGRMALLGSIPVVSFFSLPSFGQLYLVAFLAGTLTVFFDIAYQAYLPSLVRKEELIDGNSKLELSRSFAQIVGPAVAGGLVALVTAPFAVAIDALSFLVAALGIATIREPETVQSVPAEHQNILQDIKVGLHFVLSHRLLRPVVCATSVFNLFFGIIYAQQILFMTRTLHLSPVVIGIIFAIEGPSALLGALLTTRVSKRLGIGRAITLGGLLLALSGASFAIAGGSFPVIVTLILLSQVFGGFGGPLYNITAVSLRQGLTPDHLLGRVNATARVIIMGTIPFGALLGGGVSGILGLRLTLLLAASGMLLAFGWLVLSPLFAYDQKESSIT